MNGKAPMRKILRKLASKNKLIDKMMFKYYYYKGKREYLEAFKKRNFNINIENFVDTSNSNNLNVIIIVVDCLRYLNTSFSGYHRKTTPFMDSSKIKLKAITPAPWTHPSVASILTGLYPHNHGAYIRSKIRNFDNIKSLRAIEKHVLTLPEILYALKYDIYFATSIEVASYPLKGRVVPRYYPPHEPAEKLLNDLKKWIKRRQKPFMAYVQLGDLHEPIILPKNFKNFFRRVEKLPNIERWAYRRPIEQKGSKFQKYKRNRILLYDNALRYVDHSLQDFYRFLEKEKLLDSTILIITGDHGEEFWEHAELEAKNFYDPRGFYGVGHGHNVFNEIISTPLLIEGAFDKKENLNRKVSLVDITPTILDLLEVQHTLVFDGQNLFKQIDDNRALISEAVAYGYEKKSLIIGNYKLLYAPSDGVIWVFNLEEDPQESNPIFDSGVSEKFINLLNKIILKDRIKMLKWKLMNKNKSK